MSARVFITILLAAITLQPDAAWPEAPTTASSASTTATTTTTPATSPTDVDAEIDALLKQLTSDEWSARVAAQNRLAALGDLAVPRLKRAAREADDAEVRTRCESALQQIAEGAAIGPTLITMRVHQVSPQIAFQEIGRQAGIELKPHHPSLWNMRQLPPVTLDVQREPFWQVIARVNEQCGLDVEQWNNGVAIMPTGMRGAGKAPAIVHGAFRIRATRVARSYAVDLTNGGAMAGITSDFTVMLMAQAEPKLKVAGGFGDAKLEVASDENGLSLLPPDAAGDAAARGRVFGESTSRSAGSAWPAVARLAYPAAPAIAGKRIARLKGTVACSAVVRSETLEVPDILNAQNVTKEVAGTTVTIRHFRRAGNQFELALTMARDPSEGGIPARVLRGQGLGGIRLLDTTGRPIPQQGSSTSTQDDRMEVTLHYPAGPGPVPAAMPAKLVWEIPTELRNVDIPFEFTDLPLP